MPFYVAFFLLAVAISAEEQGDTLLALTGKRSSQRVSVHETEHRVLQQLANARKPTAGLVLSLQQLAADVVERQENCSDTIQSVIDPALNETSIVIEAELNQAIYDQARINASYDRIIACSAFLDSPSLNSSSVSAARETHGTCRTEQQELSQNNACAVFESFQALLSYPDCVYTSSGTAASVTGDCMQVLSDWLAVNHDAFLQKQSACDAATQNLQEKQHSCNLKQETFEMAFCIWASATEQHHNDYATCYAQESASYNATVIEVKASIATSEAEYVAAKQTQCLLLFLQENPSNASQAHLAQCNEVDTSMLEMTYYDMPAQVTPPPLPASKPCDDVWLQDEYTGKTWYHTSPTTTCVACVAVA